MRATTFHISKTYWGKSFIEYKKNVVLCLWYKILKSQSNVLLPNINGALWLCNYEVWRKKKVLFSYRNCVTKHVYHIAVEKSIECFDHSFYYHQMYYYHQHACLFVCLSLLYACLSIKLQWMIQVTREMQGNSWIQEFWVCCK